VCGSTFVFHHVLSKVVVNGVNITSIAILCRQGPADFPPALLVAAAASSQILESH
jgi:hypothetical protein